MIRWFKICSESELKPGQARSISVLARRFAVFNVAGELFGMDASCGHMKANLAAGHLTDDVIECGMHGWRYHVKTGVCLSNEAPQLTVFPVKRDSGMIWIGLEWPLKNNSE